MARTGHVGIRLVEKYIVKICGLPGGVRPRHWPAVDPRPVAVRLLGADNLCASRAHDPFMGVENQYRTSLVKLYGGCHDGIGSGKEPPEGPYILDLLMEGRSGGAGGVGGAGSSSGASGASGVGG